MREQQRCLVREIKMTFSFSFFGLLKTCLRCVKAPRFSVFIPPQVGDVCEKRHPAAAVPGGVLRLPSGPHRSLTQAAGPPCSLTALLTGDPVPWGWTVLPCSPGPLFPDIWAAHSHEYAGRCWVAQQPCARNNILPLTWGSPKGS